MAGVWKMYVDDRPWDGGRRLFMRVNSWKRGEVGAYVLPLALQQIEQGLAYDTPSLSETREEGEDNIGDVTGFLQAALETAWELGLRPKDHADHTNELKAVRYHLEDMRTLAKLPSKGN